MHSVDNQVQYFMWLWTQPCFLCHVWLVNHDSRLLLLLCLFNLFISINTKIWTNFCVLFCLLFLYKPCKLRFWFKCVHACWNHLFFNQMGHYTPTQSVRGYACLSAYFAVHLVDGARCHVGAHARHEDVATVVPALANEDLTQQLSISQLIDLYVVCLWWSRWSVFTVSSRHLSLELSTLRYILHMLMFLPFNFDCCFLFRLFGYKLLFVRTIY